MGGLNKTVIFKFNSYNWFCLYNFLKCFNHRCYRGQSKVVQIFHILQYAVIGSKLISYILQLIVLVIAFHSYNLGALGAHSWKKEYERLSDNVPCVELDKIEEHSDEVLHVSFSNNGMMFCTCSKDAYVKVNGHKFLLLPVLAASILTTDILVLLQISGNTKCQYSTYAFCC